MRSKILLGVVALFAVVLLLQHHTLKTELATKSNLVEVLKDSVHYTQDELSRIVATKKTILTTSKELEKQVGILTANQKKLLTEVKNVPKKDNLNAGIQINESIQVDSIEYLNSKTILIKETQQGTVVSVVNSNPHFQTKEVDSILMPKKKKFKDSKFLKVLLFAGGIAAGITLIK